jgi:hypothetical protein
MDSSENHIKFMEDFIKTCEKHHDTTKLFLMFLWVVQILGLAFIIFIDSRFENRIFLVIIGFIIFFYHKIYYEEMKIINKMNTDLFLYRYAAMLRTVELLT